MKHKQIEKYKLELREVPIEPLNDYKKISCPSCDSGIPADNININDKIAKCSNCDAVFPFHKEIANFINLPEVKQEVIRPEGIDIFYFQDDFDLTIQQPWTAAEILAISLLPTFAALFTLVFFEKGISIFWPAALWLMSLYTAIGLANRSKHKIHLTIDDRYLSIKWRPRKLQKDQRISVQEIDQVYVKTIGGRSSVCMIVNGVEGQKHLTLISGLDSLSKARYLEQEIEGHLGIQDRQIPEESA